MSDVAKQREPAPEFEILERTAGEVFARYGPLIIGCWRDRSSIERLRAFVSHHQEQRRRYPEGFLSMTILEHGVPLQRDPEMVDFGRATRKEFGPCIVRQGYVIPHAGFGGTMLRLMVNSLMALVPSTPSRVFQTMPEALRWLGEGPIAIVDREKLEVEMAAALGLRESTVRSSVRRRDD